MNDAALYFTGKPCKHGHVANRSVKNRTCVECTRVRWKAVDPEKRKAQKRQYYIRNSEKLAAKRYSAYWADPEKHRASARERGSLNKEAANRRGKEFRERNPGIHRRYYQETPDRFANANAKRRAKTRKVMPLLTADEQKSVRLLYRLARAISKRTGVKHEIDHRIPLSRGGLHHPDNLQILTKAKNRRKSNKTPEEFACL